MVSYEIQLKGVDLSKKLVFMILVLVIDSDFKDIMDILYIAGTEKDQLLMDIYWLCLLTK